MALEFTIAPGHRTVTGRERVVFRPDLGAVIKRAAVGHFLSLFQPGRIVALALTSDEGAA